MKRFMWALAVAVVMTSCMKPDDIKVKAVEDVSVSPGLTTAVDLVLLIENTSSKNVRVSDAEFGLTDIYDREIAVISLGDNIEIPRKSEGFVLVPIRVRVTNPLAGLKILRNIDSEASRLFVTGSAKVKIGGAKRKYEVYRKPLTAIISSLESETPTILEELQSI